MLSFGGPLLTFSEKNESMFGGRFVPGLVFRINLNVAKVLKWHSRGTSNAFKSHAPSMSVLS